MMERPLVPGSGPMSSIGGYNVTSIKREGCSGSGMDGVHFQGATLGLQRSDHIVGLHLPQHRPTLHRKPPIWAKVTLSFYIFTLLHL
jgi:hypothetical protein